MLLILVAKKMNSELFFAKLFSAECKQINSTIN